MEIKLLINNKAKKTIKNMIKKINDNEKQFGSSETSTSTGSWTNMHIERWLDETNNVKCFILYENEIIKTFALLSKCDYDPLNTHDNPYILDFIYTFISYRRNKLAYKLLLYMKNTNNITAFCSNDESFMLFQKAEYVLTKYDESPNPTFRYP